MINHSFELEGQYCIQLRNYKTGITRQIGPFKNLITNQGLNSFGGINTGFTLQNCFVGNGTTAPAVTDIAMANKLNVLALTAGGTQVMGNNEGAPNYSSLTTVTYTFPVGDVVGNISEVGVGRGTLSFNNLTIQLLFSRSLISDANGNPITITVLPDESLTVIYYLRAYPNLSDETVAVVDQTTGVTHTLKSRIYNCAAFRNTSSGLIAPIGASSNDQFITHTQTTASVPVDLAAVTSATPFTGSTAITAGARTVVILPYVADSYSRTSTITMGLSSANSTLGLSGIGVQSGVSSLGAVAISTQILVTPPIMKTALNTLAIDLSISWSRRT